MSESKKNINMEMKDSEKTCLWYAVDKDGAGFFYEDKPRRENNAWVPQAEGGCLISDNRIKKALPSLSWADEPVRLKIGAVSDHPTQDNVKQSKIALPATAVFLRSLDHITLESACEAVRLAQFETLAALQGVTYHDPIEGALKKKKNEKMSLVRR